MTSGTLTVTDCTAVNTRLYTEADLTARVEAEHEKLCDAAIKAAYKQGWNDREGDFVAGTARIGIDDAAIKAAREEGMEERREVIAALEIAAELPSSNRCQAFVKAFVEGAPWALADVQKHLAAIRAAKDQPA